TKVFTGILMAQAVIDRKISVDDDIRKYITGTYPNLEYKGVPVTIKDLVSLKSGFSKDLPNRESIFKGDKDSIVYRIKRLEDHYTKEHFFSDLKSITLDTFPGKVYKYNNGNLQLAAHILENVYGKSYDALLQEKIFIPYGFKHTKLRLAQNENLVNGYNQQNKLMPHSSIDLWGSSGSLKSTLMDILNLVKLELDQKNTLVIESQKDLLGNKKNWKSYFWDNATYDNNGLNFRKHGGAFGTQNLLWVFPDYDMGISVLINQSDEHTANPLFDATRNLLDDLKPLGKKSIAKAIKQKCQENITEGIIYYRTLKKENAELYDFSDESELNSLGYRMMREGNIPASIKIFELMTLEFPQSSNAFDSLGEGYFNNRDYAMSKQSYLKSLELDPNNSNAHQMLDKIKNISK
ncbi:MAG: serine hydrolase, partial [Leadbetterella sp.]